MLGIAVSGLQRDSVSWVSGNGALKKGVAGSEAGGRGGGCLVRKGSTESTEKIVNGGQRKNLQWETRMFPTRNGKERLVEFAG